MSVKILIYALIFLSAVAGIYLLVSMSGDGTMERMTTLRGIYPVCRPGGYPAVCFGVAGAEGVSCIPFTGECR